MAPSRTHHDDQVVELLQDHESRYEPTWSGWYWRPTLPRTGAKGRQSCVDLDERPIRLECIRGLQCVQRG
jgi:hypothetical protein